MIFIQVILIASFLYLLLRFLAEANSSKTKAWKKIGLTSFVLVAIITILFPSLSDTVAHVVGVGRGADLLLYLMVAAFIFFAFNGYVYNKMQQRKITQLARKIAIIEANEKYR